MEGSTSPQAALALLAFIPITFYLFKKYPPGKAGLLAFMGGMCFLPELMFFKLPLMPELDKVRLPQLVIFAAVMLFARQRLTRPVEPWWFLMPFNGLALGVVIWLTNREPLVYGPTVLSGMTFKDGMYLSANTLIGGVLVSYLGMKLFSDERDLKRWLLVLAGCGLIYTVFVLIEVRLSPQTHRWVYGFHPHPSFAQTMRYGGFRPQVFMSHGLATSLFMLGAAMAATVAARFDMRVWKLSGAQAAWVLIVAVILCKSTGVWFYALFALPLARWGSAKAMTRLAVVLTVLTCLYPYLRATDRFPVQALLDYADSFDHERMLSLKFRFDNETVLIEHALKKPWFGWGSSYNRNRVFDAWGNDITVTDGGWIIAFGGSGIVGVVGYLGLTALCVLAVAWRTSRIRDPRARIIVAALNLYVAIAWLDVLPNGTYNLLPQFLGGALCAISDRLSRTKAKPKPKPKPPQAASPPAPSQVPVRAASA